MLINKAREEVRGYWMCNFKWVVWKDLSEKEMPEQLFEWGESMTQVESKGKVLKQWNGKCRSHDVIPRQVCVRSRRWLMGASRRRRGWCDIKSEKEQPHHTGPKEGLRIWAFPLRYREGRGFELRTGMIRFMFPRDYSSGCAENWLWRSEVRSGETIRKLFL